MEDILSINGIDVRHELSHTVSNNHVYVYRQAHITVTSFRPGNILRLYSGDKDLGNYKFLDSYVKDEHNDIKKQLIIMEKIT